MPPTAMALSINHTPNLHFELPAWSFYLRKHFKFNKSLLELIIRASWPFNSLVQVSVPPESPSPMPTHRKLLSGLPLHSHRIQCMALLLYVLNYTLLTTSMWVFPTKLPSFLRIRAVSHKSSDYQPETSVYYGFIKCLQNDWMKVMKRTLFPHLQN